MTRKCHLYIRNADGKDQFKEEFICEVLVKFSESDETRNPPIKNGNAEETNDGGTTDSQTIDNEKITITSYTREDKVTKHFVSPVTELAVSYNQLENWPTDFANSDNSFQEILLQVTQPQFHKKFTGLGNYLMQRSKAAVIPFQNKKQIWYLLPPKQKDSLTLIGLVGTIPLPIAPPLSDLLPAKSIPPAPILTIPSRPPSSLQQDNNHESSKDDAISSPNPSHTQEEPLGNHSTNVFLPAVVIKEDIDQKRGVFKSQIKERLAPFFSRQQSNTFHFLEFEPMVKEQRSIIHAIIEADHPTLLSCSIGEYNERRVIVYRKGRALDGMVLPPQILYPNDDHTNNTNTNGNGNGNGSDNHHNNNNNNNKHNHKRKSSAASSACFSPISHQSHSQKKSTS